MYNSQLIRGLISDIHKFDGCNDKDFLETQIQSDFRLDLQRSVYTCRYFSIRFSKAESINFANVVISLSTLKKYDSIPFFVCVVTPKKNYLLLANTYLIDKASHSSSELRMDNIKGSILGSNIIRSKDGLDNIEDNFEKLFNNHVASGCFEGNLERIVENTGNIVGTKESVALSEEDRQKILDAVERSNTFIHSEAHDIVFNELKRRVNERVDLIKLASRIDNINVRGRLVEYIITGDDYDLLWGETMGALRNHQPLPHFSTRDDLGDYTRSIGQFHIKADIKSEMMSLSSNPKGYNVDKMLDFLSDDKSVFCLFFVGIDENKGYRVSIAFCSMFDDVLLSNTRIQHHWSGRGTRGVAQFEGNGIKKILNDGPSYIDIEKSLKFLEELINKGD